MSERPAYPLVGDDHHKLSADERRVLLDQYYLETRNWYAAQAGRVIIGRVGDTPTYLLEFGDNPPLQFCVECYAGCSPEFQPQRGLDSYGGCAEDGDPVYWTVAADHPPVDVLLM